MYKDIPVDDRSIAKSYKVYKTFKFNETDSGSGIFAIQGLSSSAYDFRTGSAASQSYGSFSAVSKSLGLHSNTWYSYGTFYKLPTYFMVKNLYYQYDNIPNPKSNTERYINYAGGNWLRKWPHGRIESNWGIINPRDLKDSVNVITIPQQFFGEEIKPGSVVLEDSSGTTTVELRDDGHGQLYDFAYSASFATGSPGGNPLTGSAVGNVFYEYGIITITDTGSLYKSCSIGSVHPYTGQYGGSDGFTLEYQATQTNYEYEYLCNIPSYHFNYSTNPSLVQGRSGSITIPSESVYLWNDSNFSNTQPFTPTYENVADLLLPPASSSYANSYSPGVKYEGFISHSEFGTYVTNIGLYNDQNELLAISKLSNPIKNDPELDLSFLIRFDV